jgi:uncharacterized membrane protein YfcA
MVIVGLGYLLAFFMGATLGLIGAGGSILTLPILVYFLSVPPVVATGYSLFLVGITALVGAVRLYIKGELALSVALSFLPPSLIATYASRRYFLRWIPDTIPLFEGFEMSKDLFLMLLFALLMVGSGLFMIRGSRTRAQGSLFIRPPYTFVALGGMLVGSFTGLIGAGGGFLIIPALILLAGLEMKEAVGSSLVIIAAQSLAGFVGDLNAGIPIDTTLLLTFLSLTIGGMLFGTAFSNRFKPEKLRYGFGLLTLFCAALVLFKELY